MRIKNENEEFEWSSWIPYETEYPWTLYDEPVEKVVPVEFKDYAGNISEDAFSDTIELIAFGE
jgi:hypothetical protein